jgi:hypothetical protein
MTPAEFLAARLDEDEAHAQLGIRAGVTGRERMLREVEAKRKILDLYEAAVAYDDTSLGVATLRAVIGTLAGIWRDHPDYEEAMRP